jgi:hypothetical protein
VALYEQPVRERGGAESIIQAGDFPVWFKPRLTYMIDITLTAEFRLRMAVRNWAACRRRERHLVIEAIYRNDLSPEGSAVVPPDPHLHGRTHQQAPRASTAVTAAKAEPLSRPEASYAG